MDYGVTTNYRAQMEIIILLNHVLFSTYYSGLKKQVASWTLSTINAGSSSRTILKLSKFNFNSFCLIQKLIGLNYKDNPKNAKKFIDEFGNPYFMIITDKNGIISIDLGAIGVPETFIINKDKKIIKRFLGSLNEKSLKEINLILK